MGLLKVPEELCIDGIWYKVLSKGLQPPDPDNDTHAELRIRLRPMTEAEIKANKEKKA